MDHHLQDRGGGAAFDWLIGKKKTHPLETAMPDESPYIIPL